MLSIRLLSRELKVCSEMDKFSMYLILGVKNHRNIINHTAAGENHA